MTYVEPYFSEAELRARPTSFEQNHNIRRFVFETPYSKGKTGHVSELHKRKTILTLKDNKAFPYMKTRCGAVGEGGGGCSWERALPRVRSASPHLALTVVFFSFLFLRLQLHQTPCRPGT